MNTNMHVVGNSLVEGLRTVWTLILLAISEKRHIYKKKLKIHTRVANTLGDCRIHLTQVGMSQQARVNIYIR